jgi:catechol 2,3-dioxygenase-like lactoylglutathione lyase family enzyme
MAIDVRLLGYVGLAGQDLAAWEKFAGRLLGAQTLQRRLDDGSTVLALRLDGKCHRFLLSDASEQPSPYFGFELADDDALRDAKANLRANGIEVTDATSDELFLRKVAAMAWLRDPDGYRLELYHGLEDAAEPFRPNRPMGGFRTG